MICVGAAKGGQPASESVKFPAQKIAPFFHNITKLIQKRKNFKWKGYEDNDPRRVESLIEISGKKIRKTPDFGSG